MLSVKPPLFCFNPATLYQSQHSSNRANQFTSGSHVNKSLSPHRSRSGGRNLQTPQQIPAFQKHPPNSSHHNSSSLYWSRTTPCLETVDEHQSSTSNSTTRLASSDPRNLVHEFPYLERQVQSSQSLLLSERGASSTAPYGRSRRSDVYLGQSRPLSFHQSPNGGQLSPSGDAGQFSPNSTAAASFGVTGNPDFNLKRGANLSRTNQYNPNAVAYGLTPPSNVASANNSSNNTLDSVNNSGGYYSSNSSTNQTLTPLSGGSPTIQSPGLVPSPPPANQNLPQKSYPNYPTRSENPNRSQGYLGNDPQFHDPSTPIWQLRTRPFHLDSSSEALHSDSATDRLQRKVSPSWFTSAADAVITNTDYNKSIKASEVRNKQNTSANQRQFSPDYLLENVQTNPYKNSVHSVASRSNAALTHERSQSHSPGPKPTSVSFKRLDQKLHNSRQQFGPQTDNTSLNGSVEDIWVRKTAAASNNSVSQSSLNPNKASAISEIETCIDPNSEESKDMAPQRSYKLIDPCLHSSANPQNATFRLSDMKQSRTSVSIQSDSYNFGGPIRKPNAGGMCTTQSISSLDAIQDEFRGSEILPIGEFCDSLANGVENIVTSYEKLEVEEKTGTMNKLFSSWSGDKNRICMKPPPFKAAVASLYSLKTQSNNSFSDWTVNRVGMSKYASNSERSNIDNHQVIASVPGTPIQESGLKARNLSGKRQANSYMFSTQSEMNVANVANSNENQEAPNQSLLKNYRSELILAQTLSSVDSLALKRRSKSQVGSKIGAAASQRAKSSSDLSFSSALTISDDFGKSNSSSHKQKFTTSDAELSKKRVESLKQSLLEIALEDEKIENHVTVAGNGPRSASEDLPGGKICPKDERDQEEGKIIGINSTGSNLPPPAFNDESRLLSQPPLPLDNDNKSGLAALKDQIRGLNSPEQINTQAANCVIGRSGTPELPSTDNATKHTLKNGQHLSQLPQHKQSAFSLSSCGKNATATGKSNRDQTGKQLNQQQQEQPKDQLLSELSSADEIDGCVTTINQISSGNDFSSQTLRKQSKTVEQTSSGINKISQHKFVPANIFRYPDNEVTLNETPGTWSNQIGSDQISSGAIRPSKLSGNSTSELRHSDIQCEQDSASADKNSSSSEKKSEDRGRKCIDDGVRKSNSCVWENGASNNSGNSIPNGLSGEQRVGVLNNFGPAVQAISDAINSLQNSNLSKSAANDRINPKPDFKPVTSPDQYSDLLAEDELAETTNDSSSVESSVNAEKVSAARTIAEKMINELTEQPIDFSEESVNKSGDNSNTEGSTEFDISMTQPPDHYPEFTGAEDHRDLTTAFSEFASAISSLITIADCPNSISPPSTINPKIPENPPRLDNAATASPRKTPDIIIAPSNSPPGDPYDVTPTNELADQLESAVTSQSQRVASQANRVTSFASLYPELDMKIDEFLASSQPPTSIEILLERLKRPQSIHIFQKLIGRSKSTPGSLNEVSNVGRLRPLRVPKDLKGASWNWRIKRSFNNLTETQPNTPMIPRRPKNKRKFMRDDLDRCKSVPLTKEEIQSLSHESQTDGIASLPSVTNLHELGLYEYVDVNSELNMSMQKMFTMNGGSNHSIKEKSDANRVNNANNIQSHNLNVEPKSNQSVISFNHNSVNHQEQVVETPVNNNLDSSSIKERLNSSAASTCANIDVSQLIMQLCCEDDADGSNYEYDDDDDEGGGIRDPEPIIDDDGIEIKDEYFASELITCNTSTSNNPDDYLGNDVGFNNNNNNDEDPYSLPFGAMNQNNNRGLYTPTAPGALSSKPGKMGPPISRNGLPSASHPPPVVPFLAGGRQIIERSATYPRTLDEIAECANE
ncbi:uncharacterized protein LOC142339458 isoform X4 [Convolutriloba macropyga]|uniref:uncharacterized protein LOC142339458 isoform X4 n=1 Tax=Convolutriloba macropyga TaxID=536237 RepID=UPI003F51F707